MVSDIAVVSAGIPLGGILSPIPHLCFGPTSVADYADDKTIISINNDPLTASTNLKNPPRPNGKLVYQMAF